MWFFLGLILGIGLVLLILWLRNHKLALSWYHWSLAIAGLALLLLALHSYRTSIAEHEAIAAGIFALIFGLPGILLIAVAVLLAWWRQFRKAKAQQQTPS